MLEPGMQVGAYRVVGPIGRGGMGGVVEVEDAAGTRFAMKSPLVDVDATGEVTRRFAREANTLRLLEHPNLVAAIDVFVEAGALYLVMEKVTGRTLGKAIAAGLAPRQVLVFARQVLEGVGHAHAHGFVHRDLKPDNILLAARDGWELAKIIDFGLVKLVGDAAAAYGSGALTRTGIVNGTPAYMAPEQALNRVLDGRADLYAVGVMLYEALAGRLPFSDPDPMIVMRQHVKIAPTSLLEIVGPVAWTTPHLLALVARAMAKQPDDRYSTADDMIAALDAAFASIDHLG
jgi:serine/threonine protein kinase